MYKMYIANEQITHARQLCQNAFLIKLDIDWSAESRHRKTCRRVRPDTNKAVQTQKMDRGLKFRIWEVERLY